MSKMVYKMIVIAMLSFVLVGAGWTFAASGLALQSLDDITYERNYVISVDGVTCKFVKYTLAPTST
jgi:hypothetical protein